MRYGTRGMIACGLAAAMFISDIGRRHSIGLPTDLSQFITGTVVVWYNRELYSMASPY
jgi:hypothetical protein